MANAMVVNPMDGRRLATVCPLHTHALLPVLVEHFRTLDIRFNRGMIWTPERVVVGMLTLISQPSYPRWKSACRNL
jgi:hypothetical protein